MRILLIEDEPTLREQLHQALLQAGHTVETAADGETAQYLGEVESFDAAVLDLGLPVRDGLSVLRAWRAQGRSMPVLILTARAAWHEKVAGMDAGADDYLAKPFHMEELLARLRALLRRLSPHASALWQCGSITLDSRQARVTVEGQALTLTSHEFKVLALLMQRMGAVVSRTELSEHIYPQDSDRDSNTIEVFVGRLRKNCPQARSKPCAAWAIAWLRHPTKNKAYVRAHPDLPMTQQPPPLSAGSWKNSLRLRLLAGALIWVLAALLLTGWGLRTLFAEHLTQQLRSQLVAKLDRLSGAVNYQPDQAVPVTVSPFSGDPLLQQPLSGMYWQVDQLDAAGKQTVQAGIQRSRSLWDQTLDWPFFKADKVWEPTLPLHAPASYGHMSDGNGNTLVIVTRTVQLPEADAPPLRLMIAADAAMLATPLQRFTKMLVAALCMLAAGLIAAVVVQLQLALAPLAALRRQLAAVSQGEASEIRGEHPAEIMPLVQEFNHVLRMNAEMVERARTQAGNLAHAVNTPLSIMGNAAAQQDSPLATLVREQVASASRQVEYHLARARAAAAAAQQGHGLRTALAGPLHSLVHTMDKLHAARSIRFELQGDATQWDFKGDSQDLMEMLGNLLDNAGKWARSKVVLKVQPSR
jgi:DNA-binding response OmpR family regulator/signal transduction histidine kinase